MDKSQKINCTVNSCKYNNSDTNACTLKQIIVEPTPNCENCTPDESKCGSYTFYDEDDE